MYRQKTKPNLSVPAQRGWCLKYCDDGINAPNRQPTAQAAYDVEKRNTNTRTGLPPVKVWAPIFLSFNSGAYKGIGHVAWAYNRGDGTIDIVDSEVRAGARSNYNSIEELLAWFSAYSPKYLGWSLWLDGRQVVEQYSEPKPPTPPVDPPKPPVIELPDTIKVGDTLVLEVKEIRK